MRAFLRVFAACFVLIVSGSALRAQVNTGELRLQVMDAGGSGLKATVAVSSEASHFHSQFATDRSGALDLQSLTYGIYLLDVEAAGFKPLYRTVEVHSALPAAVNLKLEIAPVTASVRVKATIVDPSAASSVMQIGEQQIDQRLASLPGRSVQDLVNAQPGWLYEGNAVLHPRGSEYQTQFVVDGVPLTDNRSPSFGPEIEADDLASMSVYTAGFPAEYGRKMGGVVELNTRRDTNAGLHGQLVVSGGSYDTAQAFGDLQAVEGKNTYGVTGSGSMSSHYLNPVVPQNYTNRGTTGDFSGRYERDLTEQDRLVMSVRHELSRYEVPNEYVQQQAGQRQDGDNFETIGTVSYQHIFSPEMLGNLVGMVRDNANDLDSNAESTPIIATQHNDFREGYFKGTLTLHHANQEWKGGVEADTTFLHETFSDTITDATSFDPGTPGSFSFHQSRPDLEQAAFVEDLVRLGKWTISAGLRWDHYQLILNQNAFSPRVSIGRYFPSQNTVLHFSYDRIFQTPSFENILLSSSAAVISLDPSVLRLPVKPSTGTYYEGGLTKAFAQTLRLDVNFFRRDERNYADDDQLLNTGISYPIAFDKAVLYGAEGKLDVLRLGKLSGFVSYSYIVGNCWFPVTGGLFLGDDVTNALTQLTGHFPDSQDQRNTARTRFQYQALRRVWLAGGLQYGSGLPFDFDGTPQQALAEYGPQVEDRLNFARGRILPTLALSSSLGVDVYKRDAYTVRFQADGDNLNNRLNVIDFGGLFSGNAIGPGRSFNLRLGASF